MHPPEVHRLQNKELSLEMQWAPEAAVKDTGTAGLAASARSVAIAESRLDSRCAVSTGGSATNRDTAAARDTADAADADAAAAKLSGRRRCSGRQ